MSSISVSRDRPRTALRARVMALAAATVIGWLATPATALAADAEPTLTDDAGGQPMFSGPDPLSPGMSRSRCITITATGAQAGDLITFAASATGDLASWLTVTAEVGTGGGHLDCQGFTGQAFYRGKLSSLAESPGDGVSTGWQPDGVGSRSFRITIDVERSNAALGRTAEASFGWRLVRGPEEEPLPTPTSTSPPTSTPSSTGGPTSAPAPSDPVSTAIPGSVPTSTRSDVPAGVSSPGITTPATSTSSAAPTTTPRPVASVDVPAIGGGTPDTPSALTEVLQQFSDTMRRIAQEPGFTVGPLLLALIFLLTQHLIDMRDPKLAAASRTKREIMLQFPVRYGESMHDPRDQP